MKHGEVRVYTNDRPTLDQLPGMAEVAALSSRSLCQNTPCELACLTEENPANSDSIKLVAIYVCENSVNMNECIATIRTAASIFDDGTDVLDGVSAATTMIPLFEDQNPNLRVVSLDP